jgi:hypothetical protein
MSVCSSGLKGLDGAEACEKAMFIPNSIKNGTKCLFVFFSPENDQGAKAPSHR